VLIVGSFSCCCGVVEVRDPKIFFLKDQRLSSLQVWMKITRILRRENAAITLEETDMRSIISRQARNCLRSAVKGRHGVPCSGLRRSSSEARQWSTPLAKQLHEAITVYFSSSNHPIYDG
jgi:hypothetical protein